MGGHNGAASPRYVGHKVGSRCVLLLGLPASDEGLHRKSSSTLEARYAPLRVRLPPVLLTSHALELHTHTHTHTHRIFQKGGKTSLIKLCDEFSSFGISFLMFLFKHCKRIHKLINFYCVIDQTNMVYNNLLIY